ncbi:fimbrial protein [Moellerella wisconsensis]|uniref:fimbrial protein n=1 Tax=Moellerella wisconsensis TaxID=158849 RepID=UPI001F4E1892|nr:fimbrial protein [Moellerella wisconsensis]UNH25488.1 fimbrial protein [Moellerella wisconsensis]
MKITKVIKSIENINPLKLVNVFYVFIYLFSLQAQALYIDSDITDLTNNKNFYSKSYVNNTKNINMYTISMYRIDLPGEKEDSHNIEDGEIIYTPLKKILLPKEREYFKIFYRGKSDNQERYYRMVIAETSLGAFENENKNKNFHFTPTISLDTYFVVRPRDIKFSYTFNQKNGLIKNTGNTYFQIISHKSCIDEEPEVLYLLPSQTYQETKIKHTGNKFIVFMDKFILLDSPCK